MNVADAPKSKHTGRRPRLLEPNVRARLLEAAPTGASLDGVSAYGGIDLSTLMDWLAKGRAGKSPYVEFTDEFTRARDKAEVTMAALLMQAAKLDWRAAAKWLACRRPEIWSERQQLELSGSVQTTAPVVIVRELAGGKPNGKSAHDTASDVK